MRVICEEGFDESVDRDGIVGAIMSVPVRANAQLLAVKFFTHATLEGNFHRCTVYYCTNKTQSILCAFNPKIVQVEQVADIVRQAWCRPIS